ncbi:MAG TPA: TlpA disulfide reductase family protein [Nitrospirota bacterium]
MRLPLWIIAATLISAGAFAVSSSAAGLGTDPGKQAPPVELPDLAGRTVSLSQFKGKVVLLNFWSTLCAPCTAELPSLDRLSTALRGEGLVVLAVAIDASDKPVREFAAKNKFALTVLLDREKEVFFDQYAGPGLPATYFIDRNGIIVEKFSGPREWDSPDMKKKIRKLLEVNR